MKCQTEPTEAPKPQKIYLSPTSGNKELTPITGYLPNSGKNDNFRSMEVRKTGWMNNWTFNLSSLKKEALLIRN